MNPIYFSESPIKICRGHLRWIPYKFKVLRKKENFKLLQPINSEMYLICLNLKRSISEFQNSIICSLKFRSSLLESRSNFVYCRLREDLLLVLPNPFINKYFMFY